MATTKSKLIRAEQLIAEAKRTNASNLELIGLELTEIPKDIFELTDLKILSLSHNNISEVDDEIVNLRNLEMLGLSFNNFEKLPIIIAEMISLRSLDFWQNHLVSIPVEIKKLSNLEFLSLGFNQLQEIPRELFYFLSHLKNLDVENNPFLKMPEIKELEIFELMGYFRNETSFFGFAEIHKDLQGSFQQFLFFFPDYVRIVTGVEILFEVNKTKTGVRVKIDNICELTPAQIQEQLTDYVLFLKNGVLKRLEEANHKIRESEMAYAFLQLLMEQQKSNFESNIRLLSFEKEYLQKTLDKLLDNPKPIQLLLPDNFQNTIEDIVENIQQKFGEQNGELLRELTKIIVESKNEQLKEILREFNNELQKPKPDKNKLETIKERIAGRIPSPEKAVAVIAVIEKIISIFS